MGLKLRIPHMEFYESSGLGVATYCEALSVLSALLLLRCD